MMKESSAASTFVCPNCEESVFPDEAGTVVCPECGATIETTDESLAARRFKWFGGCRFWIRLDRWRCLGW